MEKQKSERETALESELAWELACLSELTSERQSEKESGLESEQAPEPVLGSRSHGALCTRVVLQGDGWGRLDSVAGYIVRTALDELQIWDPSQSLELCRNRHRVNHLRE